MPILSARTTALAMVLLATVALAFKGVLAKLAYGAGMDVAGLLLVRFAGAVPLLWLGVVVAGGRGGGSTARMGGREWRDCVLAGGAFFIATVCDFTAVVHMDVGLARLVLFTFPAFVVLLEALRRRRAPAAGRLGAMALAYAGLVLALAPGGVAQASAVGIAWALGSAISYALFLVASQGLTRRIGALRFTAASSSVTLALTVAALPVMADGAVPAMPAAGLAWGLVIAIACTVVPFFLLFEGVRRAGAVEASLATLSGPVLTALLAWAVLGETLTAPQLAGFAVTVAGIAWLSRPPRAVSGPAPGVQRSG